MLAQQSLIYSASRPRTQICWDCGRVAAYAERGCQDCWMCEQHKGVCKTERKFRERWRKVYYSSSLLLLILPGKNFTFTCLSYKFHMIGSGAAYQREEKVPDKGSAESWRIAPTHLPWEHFFPLLFGNGDKTCIYPVLPQQDARWQMSTRSNKRLSKRAQTSDTPA